MILLNMLKELEKELVNTKMRETLLETLISQAKNTDFSVIHLTPPFNFESLFSSYELKEIERKANSSLAKFWSKRGKEAIQNYAQEVQEEQAKLMSEKLSKYYYFRWFLDSLLSKVLSYYGILGGEFVDYRNLANSILGKLRRNGVSNVKEIVESKIKEWKERFSINEEIGRVVSYIVVKLYIQEMQRGQIW